MPRVIVLDDLSEEGLRLLQAEPDFEVVVQTGLKGDALRDALRDFDGAICRSGVKISAESLAGNTRLQAIVRAGVGTDNIDKAAATRQGVIVMNTPAGNTVSTAEHTFALLLGLARNLAPAHASLLAGKWDRKNFEGVEVRGKNLGIIGLGRIGLRVAHLAKAFEMKVWGLDPFLPRERAQELEIQLADNLDELLSKIDFLTVHTPLSNETNKLIGREQIAKMKRGVRLVNCARGGIYDEAALLEGLQTGQLGGVALDVYESEPNTTSPLFREPKTLCTPHLGASTEEAQRQVAVEAAELLIGFLRSGEIRQAVNIGAVDVKTLQRLRGFLNVAYRLGSLMAQWHGGAIDRCELSFDGEVAGEDTRLLTGAFAAGLLSGIASDVNLVNAELLCRERGIELVRSSRTENVTFNSLITVTVSGEGQSLTAAGTVFGRNLPRLVRLQQYQLDAFMDGHLLVFCHRDVPGIIGYIGTNLAKENVNVAQMSVGRAAPRPGGEAVGVLNLDTPAPEAALNLLSQHPQIQSARMIKLPPADFFPDLI
ncbi:MAG: phosphoglycerate dehydrogenase [Planctomycetota bacterium]|jgi:D-3-phosphoglycerate dehydrogenase